MNEDRTDPFRAFYYETGIDPTGGELDTGEPVILHPGIILEEKQLDGLVMGELEDYESDLPEGTLTGMHLEVLRLHENRHACPP